MKKVALFILFCGFISANAQIRNKEVYEVTEMEQFDVRENIHIPNFGGYQTLKCDFHIHTVFSDGKVWPDVRVNEAWRDGLDAIAITDHIEYRPQKDILQGDLNESYKIAKKRADEIGFILIQGIEVTRSKPLGHLNALFIKDANPLNIKDSIAAINEACKQGAFIMWNHPGWPDDKSTLYPEHERLIKENKIHGVETFNYMEYYPIAFDWCKNMNLAFMGNSDIHELISGDYGSKKNARPLTLVFASERSEKGIKDALFDKRSAVFFKGILAGKAEHLKELFLASIKTNTINTKEGLIEISNESDITYKLSCNNQLIILPAGKTKRVTLSSDRNITVLNCFTGSNEYLELTLPL